MAGKSLPINGGSNLGGLWYLTSFVYWQEGARSWDDSKQWKKQYEELKDRVNWMQKKVDEERSAVLRRYRL